MGILSDVSMSIFVFGCCTRVVLSVCDVFVAEVHLGCCACVVVSGCFEFVEDVHLHLCSLGCICSFVYSC